MARWLTQFIDQNREDWENEKRKRQEEKSQRLADWERMCRKEKIRLLKEKLKSAGDEGKVPKERMLEANRKSESWKSWRNLLVSDNDDRLMSELLQDTAREKTTEIQTTTTPTSEVRATQKSPSGQSQKSPKPTYT